MAEHRKDQDIEAVARVLAGDPAAFEDIVDRWQGPLVNLAYRYCRNEGRAEEMAQDAFLRAYRFLDRYRDEARFSTWLFTVAINVYRSQLRRLAPPEVSFDEKPVREGTDPGPDQEASMAQDERREAVRRTVSRLPPRYRDVVILYYFCDLDVAQASACLKLSDGTFKSRLHRARKLLETRLASTGIASPAGEAT